MLIELECHATGRARSRGIWEREQDAAAFHGLLAVLAQVPVGYLCYSVVGDQVDIHHLAVLPSYRRKGVASALIGQLTVGLPQGCPVAALFLEVRRANQGARRLYEGMGFKPVAERSGYYLDPPDDAVLYRLEILPGV